MTDSKTATELEMCGDDRFDLIAKAREKLLDATNIESRPDEIAVLDSILFRCWQMGWLDQLRTPEQAIAATLGSGTLTADDVLNAVYKHGARWQAIADELNATLGSGECELIHVMNEYDHSIPEWDHDECSKCGRWLDEDVNFCPGCGARVKAVER